MRRRVVVTGLGAVTPVGNDVATTWRSMRAGVSGATNITKFDAASFPVRFACEVKGFDPLAAMERKEAKRADQYTQYAVAASVEAMNDAGFGSGGFDVDRTGVIVGSGIGGLKSFEEQHDIYRERGVSKISPFFIPMFIADIASGVVSMRFNARGPNYATVSACATSAHAIGDAFRTIQYGDADVMICGGAEATVTPMAIGGFANMTALSKRNDSPETASRPFDATRDGFVMGEGAAVLVLEEYERAKSRGARIYSEVAGYGTTNDAHHMTAPRPDGSQAARSMQLALDDAHVSADEIGYVNTHGSSTPLNDTTETMAIKKVMGDRAYKIPMSGTKGYYGHALGASGAIETAICALALEKEWLPPTVNLQVADKGCDLNFLPGTGRKERVEHILTNSFGFGGINAALVLRRVI